jgi:tetratricopeptide (TPR) repeat protein
VEFSLAALLVACRRSNMTASPSIRYLLALVVLTGASLGWAQLSVGDRLVDEGRFQEALDTYQAVIDREPSNARAHYQFARAAVYLADTMAEGDRATREGWFGRAATAAERAVELAPSDPNAHFEVARALGRLAQFRGVLQSLNLAGRVAKALDEALALDPNHAASWHARALFHRDVPWIAGGRSGQVIPSFLSAIAAEPDAITHRLELARVYIDRNDPAAAREQLAVALTLPANTYFARLDLAAARDLFATLP